MTDSTASPKSPADGIYVDEVLDFLTKTAQRLLTDITGVPIDRKPASEKTPPRVSESLIAMTEVMKMQHEVYLAARANGFTEAQATRIVAQFVFEMVKDSGNSDA